MPDAGAADYQPPPPVEGWLQPLADGSGAGPDLEYDPETLLLDEVSGKPETQFGPAEPADWGRMRDICASLLNRSRDLRFATSWARAQLNVEGYSAFPAVLALLHGLLDRHPTRQRHACGKRPPRCSCRSRGGR